MPQHNHKMPRVHHQRLPYTEGSAPTHMFTPATEPAIPSESLVLISPGFGGAPEDYFRQARSYAEAGVPAAISSIESAPNATSRDPMTVRGDVLRYTSDQMTSGVIEGVKRVVLLGHSMGAAIQTGLVESPPDAEIEAIVSLHGAGSGRISLPRYMSTAPNHLKDTPRQLVDATRISMEAFINIARNPRSLKARFDIGRHSRELMMLLRLPEGHNARYYEQAAKLGIRCVEMVGPRDTVINPHDTRRVMEPVIGSDNVIDLHPEAGHFSPQTHPRATARAVLKTLQVQPTAQPSILPAA